MTFNFFGGALWVECTISVLRVCSDYQIGSSLGDSPQYHQIKDGPDLDLADSSDQNFLEWKYSICYIS